MTPAELDRCATVAAIIRPAWPLGSLKSWFAKWAATNEHRTYPDTLHAVIACYLDPKTGTPARLAESGPWWHAAPDAAPERKITMGVDVTFCDRCRGLLIPGDPDPHQCRVQSSPEVRAEAMRVAAEARGQYERAISERTEAQEGVA